MHQIQAQILLISDTDSDGLLDGVETNTGTFVDADNTGTDPHAADTDEDSMSMTGPRSKGELTHSMVKTFLSYGLFGMQNQIVP